MTTKSNRNTAKGIFRSATATIAAGVMVLSPTLAMADEAIDQGQATGNDIPEQTGGEQPIVQAQAIEDAITQGNDTPSVDEATGTEDAGEAEEVALTVATEPNPEVEQGADDVMSSDIAPTTKDEAAEQLEEAKQETQQASDELADATQGKADAQQALDDEQAREDAIAQDAADKNQAVEDTKQSTEATLDEHIEAGEGIFDNGLPRGRYSEWVDQANQMEDLYSEDDAALVQEANDLRDTVAQERQNELDKAATANGEAEASRQRLGGIQTSETVETEVASSPIFQQALSLAMGTAWQSTVLDLANETFVPIYEQFLDLAGRIANKDAL